MSASFEKRLLFIAVVLMTLIRSEGRAEAYQQSETTLEEIQLRLTGWRSSFINLRLVWEARSLTDSIDVPLPEWAPPANPEAGRLFSHCEWTWAEEGLERLEERSFARDGTSRSRTVEGFNSQNWQRFTASYVSSVDGVEKLDRLQLNRVGPQVVATRFWPEPLRGLISRRFGSNWLPKAIGEGEWSLEGFETIGGERCARLASIKPVDTYRHSPEMLWIALDHDCLVRRVLTNFVDDPTGNRKQWDFIVDEFQQLENGSWFPKRGRFQLPGENHAWLITELSIDQWPDATLFVPPTPEAATIVEDGYGPEYHMPGWTAEQEEAHVRALREPASVSPNSSTDSPPNPSWPWWIIPLVALVLLSAAGFRSYRQTHRGAGQ
jgi:hypothetical protein